MFDVEYYEKEDGTFPAEEFLLSLEPKMQAKMFREIELLEEFGNQLREPHSKMLDDGFFEIRAKVSSDITRILYFFVVNKKIILTNGFVKKTQKTPPSEIELAKKVSQGLPEPKQGVKFMGKNFRETLNHQLETNAEFRKEYEALAPEYAVARMLVACRNSGNLTQKQLAELTGINQADISKIENGNANPSVKTLSRIADAMNMNLKIEFIPKTQNV